MLRGFYFIIHLLSFEMGSCHIAQIVFELLGLRDLLRSAFWVAGTTEEAIVLRIYFVCVCGDSGVWTHGLHLEPPQLFFVMGFFEIGSAN
jgi:hypothetical protein